MPCKQNTHSQQNTFMGNLWTLPMRCLRPERVRCLLDADVASLDGRWWWLYIVSRPYHQQPQAGVGASPAYGALCFGHGLGRETHAPIVCYIRLIDRFTAAVGCWDEAGTDVHSALGKDTIGACDKFVCPGRNLAAVALKLVEWKCLHNGGMPSSLRNIANDRTAIASDPLRVHLCTHEEFLHKWPWAVAASRKCSESNFA